MLGIGHVGDTQSAERARMINAMSGVKRVDETVRRVDSAPRHMKRRGLESAT